MVNLPDQQKLEEIKRQDSLKRRLTYERCASTCIQKMVSSNGSMEVFQEILQVVRSTVQADRAYIFTVEHDPENGPYMSQVAEDCAQGVKPQIHNPELQHLPFDKGAPSLFPVLQAHEPFSAKVAEMTSPEREILESQGIVSILVVPIFARSVLWGFMGFDDCTTPRSWNDDDVRILRTIAEVMGATLSRRRAWDILERKVREERLLLDSIDTQIWYLTDTNTYGRLNKAHARFLGLDVRDIAHKSMHDSFPKSVAAAWLTSNRKVFHSGKPSQTEEWMPNTAGEKRLLAITRTPTFDETGKVDFVVCTGIDITESKKMEAEHRDMLRRLHQLEKTESLSRMAGAVAHLFNNHLQVVIGNLDLIQEDLPPDAGCSEFMKEAQGAARKAAETSELMLTFLGQLPGNPRLVDPIRTWRDCLKKFQTNFFENISFNDELPDYSLVVKADPGKLDQVFEALVNNARESLVGGGEIRVAFCLANANEITNVYRFPLEWTPTKSKYVCLAVKDNGRGLDNRTIDRIFDPFYTDKFTGRGLGLSVALGIVNSAGGCITVESRPGEGSTFRVFLPLL